MSDPKVIALLDEIRYWATLIGAGVTVWKVYAFIKGHVNTWADTLLNNHLKHLQDSLDNIDQAQSQQIELLQKIAEK